LTLALAHVLFFSDTFIRERKMLQPVSETALVDIPDAGPSHAPIYQTPDGFDLADNNAFTSG